MLYNALTGTGYGVDQIDVTPDHTRPGRFHISIDTKPRDEDDDDVLYPRRRSRSKSQVEYMEAWFECYNKKFASQAAEVMAHHEGSVIMPRIETFDDANRPPLMKIPSRKRAREWAAHYQKDNPYSKHARAVFRRHRDEAGW